MPEETSCKRASTGRVVVAPEPSAFETDPYVVDETTLTREGWGTRSRADGGVDFVRFHQHHNAQLVA